MTQSDKTHLYRLSLVASDQLLGASVKLARLQRFSILGDNHNISKLHREAIELIVESLNTLQHFDDFRTEVENNGS